MIVRVSARGQANGSADGYLCAREQLGQAERRVRTVGKATRSCGYQVLPDDAPSVTWFNFGYIFERFGEIFIGRARRIACRPGRLVGLEATAGAFTGAMERKPCILTLFSTMSNDATRPRQEHAKSNTNP